MYWLHQVVEDYFKTSYSTAQNNDITCTIHGPLQVRLGEQVSCTFYNNTSNKTFDIWIRYWRQCVIFGGADWYSVRDQLSAGQQKTLYITIDDVCVSTLNVQAAYQQVDNVFNSGNCDVVDITIENPCVCNNQSGDGPCCCEDDYKKCCADDKCIRKGEPCPIIPEGSPCYAGQEMGCCYDPLGEDNCDIHGCVSCSETGPHCCGDNLKPCGSPSTCEVCCANEVQCEDGLCRSCTPGGMHCNSQVPCCDSIHIRCGPNQTCQNCVGEGGSTEHNDCCCPGLVRCTDGICRSCTPDGSAPGLCPGAHCCGEECDDGLCHNCAPADQGIICNTVNCCSGTRCQDGECRTCVPLDYPTNYCGNEPCCSGFPCDGYCRACVPDGSNCPGECCQGTTRCSDGYCRSCGIIGVNCYDRPCCEGLLRCRADGTCQPCVTEWYACRDECCCSWDIEVPMTRTVW